MKTVVESSSLWELLGRAMRRVVTDQWKHDEDGDKSQEKQWLHFGRGIGRTDGSTESLFLKRMLQ